MATRLVSLHLAAVWFFLLITSPGQAADQGFGASTHGGEGQSLYRVTTLKESGAGSLREAVSQGSRTVVFEVAGEINLTTDIWVKGAFITIDGSTAPDPGITLKYGALLIHGSQGAHDVIVRNLRSREARSCGDCSTTGAGLSISTGAYNVVIDRVSVAKAQDHAIAVNTGAHDVTVQWSILAESQSGTGMNLPVLVGTNTRRVSLHHNLLITGYDHLPQVKYSDSGAQASDTQLDLRNNLIWNWGYAATHVWKGAWVNVVRNYYHDPGASDKSKKRAIYLCSAKSNSPNCQTSDPNIYARAYIRDNVSGHGPAITDYLNSLGTESGPFSAPSVGETDACTAAQDVQAEAGARPLDTLDQQYLHQVSVSGCAP